MSAVVPSGARTFTSAPFAISSRARSVSPFRAAAMSGGMTFARMDATGLPVGTYGPLGAAGAAAPGAPDPPPRRARARPPAALAGPPEARSGDAAGAGAGFGASGPGPDWPASRPALEGGGPNAGLAAAGAAAPGAPCSPAGALCAETAPAATRPNAAARAHATSWERAGIGSDLLDLAGAVAHLAHRHAGAIEQGQPEVRNRRVLGIDEMLSALQLPAPAAEHRNRQRILVMSVAVAHVAAVHDDRVVEDRPVAVRG